MSEHRKSPRRGDGERRKDDDRRVETRLHDNADRRKKSVPVTAERRANRDRRAASRRAKTRRLDKDRRDD